MERLIDSLLRLDMSDQLDQFSNTYSNRTGDDFFILLYQLIDIIKSSYSYPYKVLQYLLKYIPNYKLLIIIHYLNINIGYPLQYEFSRKKFLNDLIKVFPNTPPPILSKFQHLALQIISNYQILTNVNLNSFYNNEMQHIKQLYLLLSKKGYILPRPTLNEQDHDILIHKITDIDKKHVLLEELIRSGQGMDLVRANDLMKELVTSDQMSDTIRVKVTADHRDHQSYNRGASFNSAVSQSSNRPVIELPFTISHLAVEHQEIINLIINQLISHPKENQQMIYELLETLPKQEVNINSYLKELVIQHISGTWDNGLEEGIRQEQQIKDLPKTMDLLDLGNDKSSEQRNTQESGLIDFLSEPIIPNKPKNAAPVRNQICSILIKHPWYPLTMFHSLFQ